MLAGWLALGVGKAEEVPPPILPSSTQAAAAVEPADAGPPVARSSELSADNQPVEHAIFTGKAGDHVQQTAQTTTARPTVRTEETYDFSVSTELPGPERVTRRQSENDFFQRIREETRLRPGTARVVFPESPPLTTEAFQRRRFPHLVRGVEPGYVCHGRLLFEQPNFERAGWDLGVLTPVANLGAYYYDLALLPYHAWTRPFEQIDCSAGKCLPGDPTPFYLYPEEFSVTGLVGEASVVTGLFFLFP
jgi:hypothetical protein